jgi:hypothetical protein
MLVTSDPLLWETLLRRPLAERRGNAPRELIDFIGRHHQATGKTIVARAAILDAGLERDLDAALAGLPITVLRHLEPCLLGVFVMEGTGASAVSSVVAGPEGELIGAFIVLDAAVFADVTANSWFERRENMPFEAADGLRLEARIADAAHDDRVSALQFVLLHEFGHVLSAVKALAPMWWRAGSAAPSYPLLDLCWKAAPDGRFAPRAGHDFSLRGELVYYGAPRLSLLDAEAAYAALGRTGFPTLYAATSVHEDIADSFAAYVHVRLMGRPLEHRLLRGGRPAGTGAASATAYWRSPHGDARAALFEAMLDAPPY